ncbi:MAG: hypothetical protein J6Z01_11540 [Bacteroidales bacterium]|nr:hypothetical protein [Bacteroidales bacterium]
MKKIFYLIALITPLLFSCTEENLGEPVTTNYTVSIVRECLAPEELTPVTDQALVTLNIRGTEYKEYTDSLLNANFKDILSGTATVTITYQGFSQTKYVVNIIDKESQSTSVSMIPSSGKYAAELSGVLTAAGTTIPQDINIIITPQDTVSNLIKHSGKGSVSSVYVENLTRKVIAAKDGKFSVTMPATSAGIGYTIVADDFIDPVSGEMFKCVAQDISLYSGKKSVMQIKYVQPE